MKKKQFDTKLNNEFYEIERHLICLKRSIGKLLKKVVYFFGV